jgi:hypothetical protein
LAGRLGMCNPPYDGQTAEIDIDYNGSHDSNPLCDNNWSKVRDRYGDGGYSDNLSTDWHPAACGVQPYAATSNIAGVISVAGLGCVNSPYWDRWQVDDHATYCSANSDCKSYNCNATFGVCRDNAGRMGSACRPSYSYCASNSDCCSNNCNESLGVCRDGQGQSGVTRRIYGLISADVPSWDHMASPNPREGSVWGYVTEPWGHPQDGYYADQSYLFYHTAAAAPAPSHPVYRCYLFGWDHMVSTSPSCEIGVSAEMNLGYLLNSPRAGHGPLYRCRNPIDAHDHFISPASDCNGPNYATEYILGYYKLDSSCTTTKECGDIYDSCGVRRYAGTCPSGEICGSNGMCQQPTSCDSGEVEVYGECHPLEEVCCYCYWYGDPVCSDLENECYDVDPYSCW